MNIQSIWDEEPGVLSWARVHATITVLIACVILIHLAWKNSALPDATILMALAAFATAPYFVNRAGSAVEALGKK